MLSRLICILAVLLLVQAYNITRSCRSEGCPLECFYCATYQGELFNNNTVCINPTTLCNLGISQVISIQCDGCSPGVCSYKIADDSQTLQGCADTGSDQNWHQLRSQLDYAFSRVYLGNPPDWCSISCTEGGLSTGGLIGIIAGGVILVAIGIVVAVKFCKKKKAESYEKM